ncbi:S8 family peptidase [Pectobacterium carotovorum]|uniref:S8 family peptidase n=1 Tax=Pectobacterium carotovorum TaxID=554 RepID=UPI0015DDF91F|nr:S8 family peptidase [Pectobacterium carotovorum]MBA0177504.1 S8 family peptidase [Pectobacterium carotovorum]
MSNKERPIKVIEAVPDDFTDKSYNFAKKEPIRKVTEGLKNKLKKEINEVKDFFSSSFKKWPDIPAVAKVTLHEKALAKSHRPSSLLGDNTCPVIGSAGFGELLISVTEKGLSQLHKKIENSTKSHNGTVHIAVIDKIEPFILNSEDLNKKKYESYILKLFDHKDRNTNKALDKKLSEYAIELGIPIPEKYEISHDLSIYEIKGNDNIVKLANFVGIRKLEPMPVFSLSNTINRPSTHKKLNIVNFPLPEENKTYPLLGIIDSGVDPNNKTLAPWIWDRLDLVNGQHDYEHGNMVASLAINGRWLNNKHKGFPDCQSEIVDVAAFPKDGELKLPQLMKAVKTAVTTYPEVKVWNLSLGCEAPCSSESFSELGHFLNALHDEFGCLFVIASGNYVYTPQRTWPPQELNGSDRISAPADSVRSLTVGSVAHLDSTATVVKKQQPSSFSRRGPGPSFIPKPELNHFGGNCDNNLDCMDTGIIAIGPNNNLCESLGTSLATPLVSSLAASLWYELEINGKISPSPERIKTLLIHSALRNSNPKNENSLINYQGFGRPSDNISDILGCNKDEITFIFEVDTREGIEFSRTPFVIPDSLKTSEGKFTGEILMTLVYSPPLDYDYPSEYCRSNVDVSFGTYTYDPVEKKWSHSGKVPQIKEKSELYEKVLIENGFKWSPVKVYRKQFPQGVTGDQWRLKLDVQRRAEQEPLSSPQRAVLAITLRSLKNSQNVYSESINEIDKLGWKQVDIVTREQPQIRIR